MEMNDNIYNLTDKNITSLSKYICLSLIFCLLKVFCTDKYKKNINLANRKLWIAKFFRLTLHGLLYILRKPVEINSVELDQTSWSGSTLFANSLTSLYQREGERKEIWKAIEKIQITPNRTYCELSRPLPFYH